MRRHAETLQTAGAWGLELEQNLQGDSRFQRFFHMTQTYSSLAIFPPGPQSHKIHYHPQLFALPNFHWHQTLAQRGTRSLPYLCFRFSSFITPMLPHFKTRFLTASLDQGLNLYTHQYLKSPSNIFELSIQSSPFKKKPGEPLQFRIYFKSLHKERHESKFRKSWHGSPRMTMRLQGFHQTLWLWNTSCGGGGGKAFSLPEEAGRPGVCSLRAPSHCYPSISLRWLPSFFVTPRPTRSPYRTGGVLV